MSYGLPADASGAPAPTCYRHPDRETWIRCTRCSRPICPECMTAAAVGYQCPSCVAAAAAAAPRTTTVFGGRVSREGVVTMTLIGVCAVAYVLVDWLGLGGGLSRWGMQPLAIAWLDQWARLLTSMFLHAGLLHLAFNMYALYILGPPLERTLGHNRFVTLYLVAGFGGSVASYVFSPVGTLSVGASGAIFGLMAAWVIVYRRLDADVTPIVLLLALNVVLGFVIGGIDWRAHLGGAAVGAVVAAVLTTGRGRVSSAQLRQQLILVALVVVALVVVVVWRTAQIRAMFPVG